MNINGLLLWMVYWKTNGFRILHPNFETPRPLLSQIKSNVRWVSPKFIALLIIKHVCVCVQNPWTWKPTTILGCPYNHPHIQRNFQEVWVPLPMPHGQNPFNFYFLVTKKSIVSRSLSDDIPIIFPLDVLKT